MRLTLATETGDIHTVDVPADMSIADLAALAASSFPGITRNGTLVPTLKCNGRDLPGSPQTLMQAGIKNDDLIVVVRPAAPPAAAGAAVRPTRPGAPMAMGGAAGAGQQQQTPAQMQAAVNQFFASMQQMMAANNTPEGRAEMERRRQLAEKQRAIDENLAIAMEHTPEAFGRVIMLYIDGKVNGHPIKAFVDSGAQSTIMSHKLAQACGLDHLIDDRFAGMAQGVGTAKILGRVHAAQLEVGGGSTGTPPLFLMCSFTILEADNNGVDMLFGLDMLKRHQASIDLADNTLKIQGQSIPFLAEHELPEQAKDRVKEELARAKEEAERAAQAVSSPTSSQQQAAGSAAAGAAPAVPSSPRPVAPPAQSAAPGTPGVAPPNEGAIQTLMAMGVSRAEAIQALMAAGGSVDLAASLLFN